jgi:hypothetical protein
MKKRPRSYFLASFATALVLAANSIVVSRTGGGAAGSAFEQRTLDGSQNNARHPRWGRAGTQYQRVAPAMYADGISAILKGPNARAVSNRVFNDIGVNLFSEHGLSQWAWAWGQFLDHDLGLRDETPAESAPIAFRASDPLEAFTNDFGAIDFARTPAAPNTGTTSPRQQVNTLSSFIDASNVYGTTEARLEWLRAGSVDGTWRTTRRSCCSRTATSRAHRPEGTRQQPPQWT